MEPIVENAMNASDDQLPFGLYAPDTNAKLTWVCSYGSEKDDSGKEIIVGVFCFEGPEGRETEVRLLENIEMAKYVRDGLVAEGWRKIKQPKIRITTTDKDGNKIDVTRKQLRKFERDVAKSKSN
jgi:hypothetical protein